MRYRDHRGGLYESLQTTIEVNSPAELIDHLNKGWEPWGHEIAEIKFQYVGMDKRIDWDTYYVLQRLKGEDKWTVAGMSDGEFKMD